MIEAMTIFTKSESHFGRPGRLRKRTHAEDEARRYAEENGCVFVKSTDSFHLFDEGIGSGSEVYSMMRGSNLDPKSYFHTFCLTSRDRLLPLKRPQNGEK